jgi:hypothetical protein
MEPARARTLSTDPRVREVVEEVPQSDEAGPTASSTAASHADLSRHGVVPVARDSSSSGTYLYDGSGNIKFIGSDSYVYDNLGRLKAATVQGASRATATTRSATATRPRARPVRPAAWVDARRRARSSCKTIT